MATDIATKLRGLIDERRISDATLAREIGVSSTAIRRWTLRPDEYPEGDSVRRPTVPQLLLLARFFGVTMEYLADPEMDHPETDELTPDERAVLSHYRVQRRTEEAAGNPFPPEELAWRIAVPRVYGDPTIGPEGAPLIAKASSAKANRPGGTKGG